MPDISLKVDVSGAIGAFDSLLGARQRANVLTAAKRAAGTVLRKHAAKTARFADKTGSLRRSLKSAKTGTVVTRKKNVYVVAGLGDEDPYYARFVEFGHGGPRPAPPKRFMEHAAEEVGDQAVKAFTAKFIENTNKQLSRRRR